MGVSRMRPKHRDQAPPRTSQSLAIPSALPGPHAAEAAAAGGRTDDEAAGWAGQQDDSDTGRRDYEHWIHFLETEISPTVLLPVSESERYGSDI
jgi:hypothetical protein